MQWGLNTQLGPRFFHTDQLSSVNQLIKLVNLVVLSHWETQLYNKCNYYTSDSLWKIWLVESIQSIHNGLWTWHDKCNICCRYCIYHECSPQKQNGWTLRFCFWGWIMRKMYNKTIIELGFRMISWIIKTSCLCYLRLQQITQTSVLIIHDVMLNHIQLFFKKCINI